MIRVIIKGGVDRIRCKCIAWRKLEITYATVQRARIMQKLIKFFYIYKQFCCIFLFPMVNECSSYDLRVMKLFVEQIVAN